MRSILSIFRQKPFLLAVSLVTLFTFILAACGTNGGTGTGSAGPTPTPTITTVKGYGTAYGCPSDAVVNNPLAPNVTVKLKDMNSTITAHTGDLIEIDLPFGHMWGGPTTSQSNLALQQPAGYAEKTGSVCVWHFKAQSTGTTNVTFTGRPICKKGEMCPQYIIQVPFTIDVK